MRHLLIALLMALAASPLHADEQYGLEPCNRALNACISLTEAQKAEIITLKTEVKYLEDKIAEPTPSLLPWWAFVALGALGGILTYKAVAKYHISITMIRYIKAIGGIMKITNQPFASSVATRSQEAFNKYTKYSTGLPKAPSTKASGIAAEVEISQEAKSLYSKLQEGGK